MTAILAKLFSMQLIRLIISGFALPVMLSLAGFAHAIEFVGEDGVTTWLDTTISSGLSIRAEDRNANQVDNSEDDLTNSEMNFDDGNLNYDNGDIVSANAKVTHELLIKKDQYSFFGRAFYFYDYAVMDIDTARTPLSNEAKSKSRRNFTLLDAYLDVGIDTLGQPGQLRIGNQVIN